MGKYLEMPWSMEDTIENLKEIKEHLQTVVITKNLHGKGEQGAEEVAFDFDRAINALEEIQQYRAIGTVQQCKEAVEKQNVEEVCNMHRSEDEADIACYGEDALFGRCPCCTSFNVSLWNNNFCGECGQKLDWSE